MNGEPDAHAAALEQLIDREEVLEICYWYQGEGFGETFTATVLAPFLHCSPSTIETALDALTRLGCLGPVAGQAAAYRLTRSGRQQGGRLFADSFADLQKSAHGECAAGCCDGDDHSACGDDCALH